MQRPFHTVILHNELSDRIARNPRYSLRSFARDLNVDPGTMSSILSNRRPLTIKKAEKLFERINLSPVLMTKALRSVANSHNRRNLKRRDPRAKFLSESYKTAKALDMETYHIISEWYHAAILELTYLENFDEDPKWIAQQLEISQSEAKLAIERLLDTGLLVKEKGRIHKSNDHLEIDEPTGTTAARRKKQKDIRKKAIESIDRDPAETRYMTTITACIDPRLLPEARKRIDAFNDSLIAFLESGERKQVYTMEIGLFPIQKGTKK